MDSSSSIPQKQMAQPGVQMAAPMQVIAPGMQMVQPMVMVAPAAGVYGGMRRDGGADVLAPFETMFVSQGKKGCLQEMLGCEANTEFTGSQHKVGPKIFYAVEEASCCCRFFCKAQRTSKMTMIGGPLEAPTGAFRTGMLQGMQVEKIMGIFTRKFVPLNTFNEMRKDFTIFSYDRPFRCMMSNCKLCCYQEMTFNGKPAQGAAFPAEGPAPVGPTIGQLKEDCCYCVPHFTLFDDTNAAKYGVSMPTCCGGCCIDCCAEGCCNCKIPFYVYGPDATGKIDYTPEAVLISTVKDDNQKQANKHPERNGNKPAQITKLWSGFGTEVLTDADNFELVYPANTSANNKANLMGAVFFLNMNFFEAQKDDSSQ